MRVDLEPAYILHRRPYRETSLLLEVLSRGHGRLGLIARGSRRRSRRPAMPLEPVQPLLVSWTQRGDLGWINQVEPGGEHRSLSGEALYGALYLNELLLRLTTRHDPHPALFDVYRRALLELADLPMAPVLRRFEASLLQELGYGLSLTHDVAGKSIDGGFRYDYEVGRGAHPARPGQTSGLLVSGESLLALAAGRIEGPAVLTDCRRLLRAALAAHLGGRPLNTPDLFRAMHRLDKAGGSAS